MKKLGSSLIVGFIIGALVPLFWGILSLILFNVPEGWFSRLYWTAVYLTCPFWKIGGEKALVLMPLLNGCLYAMLSVTLHAVRRILAEPR